MKVIKDSKYVEITHRRHIKLEDGPILDCGQQYAPGTRIQAVLIAATWREGETVDQINITGPRINKDGSVGKQDHVLRLFKYNGYPAWLLELLTTDDI